MVFKHFSVLLKQTERFSRVFLFFLSNFLLLLPCQLLNRGAPPLAVGSDLVVDSFLLNKLVMGVCHIGGKPLVDSSAFFLLVSQYLFKIVYQMKQAETYILGWLGMVCGFLMRFWGLLVKKLRPALCTLAFEFLFLPWVAFKNRECSSTLDREQFHVR